MSPLVGRYLRAAPLLLASAFALVVCGCASDEPEIRLRLQPDPRINSEARVAEVIDRVRVVFDRAGGFSAGSVSAPLSLVDTDSDGELELVYEHAVSGESLPLLRLIGGASLGGSDFQLRAFGLVGSEIAALGGAATARFEPSPGREVTLPLDLRPRYLPPRVIVSLPQAGQTRVPAALAFAQLELSKWVRPSSVEPNVRLIYESTAGDKKVPLSFDISDTTVLDLGLREERSSIRLGLGKCKLAGGAYRLDVGTGVVDASGNALDQDALNPGDDPFSARFEVSGARAAKPCEATTVGCKVDADCNASSDRRFTCATTGADAGRCVPATTCRTLECGAGSVCQVASDGPTCVRDCRVGGACEAHHTCQKSSGLCVRCDTGPGCVEPCGDLKAGCAKGLVCDAAHSRCICPAGHACD